MSSHRVRASLLTLFVALAAAAPAFASGPWLLAPGEFHSDFRGSYFSTDTYWDDLGERPQLGGTIESRAAANTTVLGWNNLLNFGFHLPFESRTAQFGPGQRTQTGLSDLVLGLKLKVLGGATAVALEAQWKAPLGYNESLPGALGNGRQEAIGLLHVGGALPGARGFFQAAGGYRTAIDGTGDLAADDPRRLVTPVTEEIVASADLGWWLGSTLLLAGNYRGGFEGGDAEAKRTVHRVGPRVLYRVDDHLDVFAGSLHTASAENALHVDQFYVGFATKTTRLTRAQGFLGSQRRP